MTQPIVAWIVFCLTFGLGLARFAQQPPEVDPPSQSPPPAEAPPVGPPSPIPEPDAKEAKAEAMSQANPPASPRKVEKLPESPATSTGGNLDGPIKLAALTVPPTKQVSPAASAAPAAAKSQTSAQSPLRQTPAAAIIKVTVPPNATIWIDNQRMTQTGAQRSFVSPPLEHGKIYAYTMKVTWPNGKVELGQEHEVAIQAGQTTTIDFTAVAAEMSHGGMVGEAQEKKPPVQPVRYDVEGHK